jgi:hypothetical protein
MWLGNYLALYFASVEVYVAELTDALDNLVKFCTIEQNSLRDNDDNFSNESEV